MASKPLGKGPPGARRSQLERSETTQRKIVASALRLLEKVGYQNTNLQDIARGAKVTLGALQHQFGSRQVLMEQVVDAVMAPLGSLGGAWPEDPTQLPLEARAKKFVRLAWEYVYAPPSYLAAWSLFFGSKTTQELFKRIDEHRAKQDPLFFAHFAEIFPEVSCRQIEPDHFAAVVFAALRGLGVMRLFKVDNEATEHQLEVIAQMITRAGTA